MDLPSFREALIGHPGHGDPPGPLGKHMGTSRASADSKTISVGQAAEALGVHRRTVTRWIKAGTLTAIQGIPGGHWRIPLAALREKWGSLADVDAEDE